MSTIAIDIHLLGRETNNLWKFPTIGFNDAKKMSSGIDELYNGETHGFLIKGVLNQEEVDYALNRLNTLDPGANGAFSENAGYSNPKSFSMLASESGVQDALLDKYFDDIANYRKNLQLLFPFGFEERLFSLVSAMGNSKPVKTPFLHRKNENKLFTNSTIRVCYPGFGGMNTHVGNMFRGIYPKFYSFLDAIMDIENQISYFIMLSKPEFGGRLVLLDALWSDYNRMDDKETMVKSTGEKIRMKELDCQIIDPFPGDMIIFAGGDIWHRVENLIGKRDRITIGGFLAKTRDNNQIYVWA